MKSGKTIARMGDVISSWNGEGVFVQGERVTILITQMKLFNAIAAAVVITATLVFVLSPTQAQSFNYSADGFGNTYGYGSDGSSFNSTSDSFGNAYYNGRDLNGNSFSGSCVSDGFGNTYCYFFVISGSLMPQQSG